MDRWKRIALTVRIVASLVLAGVLAFVLYQLYDFYSGWGSKSPVKVTEDYIMALGAGDLERAYQLTDPSSMVTLYGRRATKSDVLESLRQVTGATPRPFEALDVTRLAKYRDRRNGTSECLQVLLPGASATPTRLVVEVTLRDGVWRITHPFGLAP